MPRYILLLLVLSSGEWYHAVRIAEDITVLRNIFILTTVLNRICCISMATHRVVDGDICVCTVQRKQCFVSMAIIFGSATILRTHYF
jgi:hypothetical protein